MYKVSVKNEGHGLFVLGEYFCEDNMLDTVFSKLKNDILTSYMNVMEIDASDDAIKDAHTRGLENISANLRSWDFGSYVILACKITPITEDNYDEFLSSMDYKKS